jgi:hypothetical protein
LALRDGHERGTSSTRFGFDCLAAPSRDDTMHGPEGIIATTPTRPRHARFGQADRELVPT